MRIAGLLLLLSAVASALSLPAADDDFGTIGVQFVHVYWEGQTDKRGPLIVVQVIDGLPAAKAGVQRGDVVIAIDGKPVMGRELQEIEHDALRGLVGSTIRLTFYHPDNTQSEMTLTRAAYPPRANPVSDPFAYSVPGSWRVEPRWNFPLEWAPSIPYHGVEELAFSPHFDDTDSAEYHSYLFFWWLEGATPISAKQLESDMLVYFRGLAEQRGQNNGFKPDPSQIAASYSADASGPATFGGASATSFRGVVSIYDTHGKVIKLNSEVITCMCPGSNHTAAFFGMSLQPRQETIWKHIDGVRDSFHCNRQGRQEVP